MRQRIKLKSFEDLKLVATTVHFDDFVAYDYYLTEDIRFSILTGSHFDSAKQGTVEVALMYKEHFIFGDDDHDAEEPILMAFESRAKEKVSDASIIHYLEWSIFAEMMGMFESLNERKKMSPEEAAALFLVFYYRDLNNYN